MPRANRYFTAGYIWHITHRCHQKEFLLKFSRDRTRWRYWLFEAKKRYGLCVLNYVVTSNHIHLLVKDTGESVISKSLQLIAGRTGQEYNMRKGRTGAYWEDRYHATAIGSDDHLSKCLVYIDLNMVRAGVVRHPKDWPHGGYTEIQSHPERYRIIDIDQLLKVFGIASITAFQSQQREWVDQELMHDSLQRDERWTNSIAIGSESFIEQIKTSLGIKAIHKKVIIKERSYHIKDETSSYVPNLDSKTEAIKEDNSVLLDLI